MDKSHGQDSMEQRYVIFIDIAFTFNAITFVSEVPT